MGYYCWVGLSYEAKKMVEGLVCVEYPEKWSNKMTGEKEVVAADYFYKNEKDQLKDSMARAAEVLDFLGAQRLKELWETASDTPRELKYREVFQDNSNYSGPMIYTHLLDPKKTTKNGHKVYVGTWPAGKPDCSECNNRLYVPIGEEDAFGSQLEYFFQVGARYCTYGGQCGNPPWCRDGSPYMIKNPDLQEMSDNNGQNSTGSDPEQVQEQIACDSEPVQTNHIKYEGLY